MRRLMRTRTIPATIFLAIIFAVGTVLLFAYTNPAGSLTAIDSTSSAQETSMSNSKVPTEFSELDSTIQKPIESKSDTVTDGPSLLTNHCTKCHTAQSLRRIEKGRTEWELTLARMEGMGVRLSDSEKEVLLDYLLSSVEP